MDILEFRDMNRPAPMPKSGVMRSNMVRWAILPPPPPFLGLKNLKTHIEKDHGKITNIYHLKMDRTDSNIVDFKHYKSDAI